MQNLWIGTSGFHFLHWKGNFYPPDLPASQWLVSDAARFDTVEINNSLYQLSGEETIQAWIAVVPAGFFRGQGQPLYHAY